MFTLHTLANFILHLDVHLTTFVSLYGIWTYALLFAIIFCETGLVVTPFLPGDSLLFAAGTLSATSNNALNVHGLFISLAIASILGNKLNYLIGRTVGPKVFYSQQSLFFNQKYLHRAQHFYVRHGAKTIIIARFIPIIRTFAPFVAGIGAMRPGQFFFYNILSAVLWIGSLIYASYWFGNIPIVKNNFSMVILSIIGISLLPPIIAFFKKNPESSGKMQ